MAETSRSVVVARVVDFALVVTTAASIESIVWLGVGPGDPIPGPRSAAAMLPALLSVPFWWRRRRPLLVCVAIACGLLVQVVISGRAVEGIHVVIATGAAAYAVAAYAERRVSAAGLAAVLGGFGLWLSQDANVRSGAPSELWAGAFFGLYILAMWLLGAVMRHRRLAALDTARAAHLEREAERAVHDERSRIARELHDIVSHNLSVMVVQAAGARAAGGSAGVDTDATLEKIESSGRSALTEMRRLLNVLRADDGRRASAAELAPIAGIDAIPALADSVRNAGISVALHVDVRSKDVPQTVDVSVYRIVQEALTNALRHAGSGTAVIVGVRREADAVTVSVIDDGPGPSPDAKSGHGLRGMSERVGLLGGELSAGPRPDGGFAVTARLPAGDV